MTKVEMIQEELKRRIENAGFEAITIEMKVNGDLITITPCGYGKLNWNNIEYFMMDSTKVNMYGWDKLEKVAETIANYEELLKENDEEIESLKEHIRKYGEDSDWDFVSDYHKDLFGHRPHVPTSQIIAWAHSDSKASSRNFRKEA